MREEEVIEKSLSLLEAIYESIAVRSLPKEVQNRLKKDVLRFSLHLANVNSEEAMKGLQGVESLLNGVAIERRLRLLLWWANEFLLARGSEPVLASHQEKGTGKAVATFASSFSSYKKIHSIRNKDNKERISLIISFFESRPFEEIRFSEVARLFPDVTGRTVRNDLFSLAQRGIVVQVGRGKGSVYKLVQEPLSKKQVFDEGKM